MGGPPDWGLGEFLTTPRRKSLRCCKSFHKSSRALVNAVMNIRVPNNARNFLTS